MKQQLHSFPSKLVTSKVSRMAPTIWRENWFSWIADKIVATCRDGGLQSRHVGRPPAPGFVSCLLTKTSTFLSVLQTPLPLLTICTLASIWKCGQELHGKQVEFLLDRWVEHSHHQPVLMSDYSNTRELSFTLADDIYIRYLSFTGAEDLEAEMIKRFNSPLSLFSVYWIQIVGVPTRLTLVLCTMRDQVITRNSQTFHHRL